ncbi:MAG: MFS transporter, partial [Polyangiaceae bacterium]|nr:MFS transporter [Polyangiaceae bacterium]
GYFTTSPVFGAMGDRSRAAANRARQGSERRVLMAAGIAVWSAATLATGMARSATALVVSRAFVGVGEASYGTLAPTIIDDMAPPAHNARWMAIFSAAMPVGSALGYIIGGAVLRAHGWRAAFWVAGVPGLALAILCLMLAEPHRRAAGMVEPSRAMARDAMALARVPLYRGAVLGYAAYTFAIGGFAYWAPAYLHVRYLLEPGRASQTFGLVTVAGGIVGTLLGGLLSDRLARARLSRASSHGEALDECAEDEIIAQSNVSVTAWATALGAPLSALCLAAPTATAFLVLAFPCQVALFALNGPINVALLKSAPPSLRAGAMAVAIFAIHALGDLWSPPLIGRAADLTSMPVAMAMVPAVFGIAAIVWAAASRASGWLT